MSNRPFNPVDTKSFDGFELKVIDPATEENPPGSLVRITEECTGSDVRLWWSEAEHLYEWLGRALGKCEGQS